MLLLIRQASSKSLRGHMIRRLRHALLPSTYYRPPDAKSADACLGSAAPILSISSVLFLTGYLAWSDDRNSTSLDPAPFAAAYDAGATATTILLNWSGTHAVTVANDHYWEPETVEEVEQIVRECHIKGQAIRPVGSALSPNGIGFHAAGMMSMANLDQVLVVDTVNRRVTVQAGARVSQVVDALRPYGLTLPNLASIAEQQMGGFVQVGAHGTGRNIAPVDHYVTQLKLVTPAKGLLTLTQNDGDLFHLAKVGLGCIGIVVEITMECIPAHKLVEHTFVLTRQQAMEQVNDLLKQHKHIRYMWIPYADAVVVVTNDPEDGAASGKVQQKQTMSEEDRLSPLTSLLVELTKDSQNPFTKAALEGMGFGALRDALLALNPLELDHVKRCNEAEAEFWRRSEGVRVLPSDQLLQFDCGGQQWVKEVAFPTGTVDDNNGNDMKFMDRLLQGIEVKGIPAHSPIEQRWTASSSSFMSPAYGPPDGLHSWVGIINYLPADNEAQRRDITELFVGRYCDWLRTVGNDFDAASHWAKLERPESLWSVLDARISLENKFPVRYFNEVRADLDPKNILANPLINMVLGFPGIE